MHTRTLCVPEQTDAERLRMHSNAERWNEGLTDMIVLPKRQRYTQLHDKLTLF